MSKGASPRRRIPSVTLTASRGNQKHKYGVICHIPPKPKSPASIRDSEPPIEFTIRQFNDAGNAFLLTQAKRVNVVRFALAESDVVTKFTGMITRYTVFRRGRRRIQIAITPLMDYARAW